MNKAVIWCEDQGDLAFFRREPEFGRSFPCAGDWVEFDLVLHGNIRLAENPVVLEEPASPALAEQLTAAAAAVRSAAPPPKTGQGGAGSAGAPAATGAVIPFPGPRRRDASAAPQRLRHGRS